MIDRLAVHGEAIVLRVTFHEPEHEPWKKTVCDLRDRGRHRLLEMLQDEFGERYELDFVSFSDDGLIQLHVAAYPPKSRSIVPGRTAYRGEDSELWILKADRVTEKIRRWLKGELLRHNEGKEVLVRAEWVPGIGVDVAGGVDWVLPGTGVDVAVGAQAPGGAGASGSREASEDAGMDPSGRGLRGRLDGLRRQQRFLRERLHVAVMAAILILSLSIALVFLPMVAGLRDGSSSWIRLGAGYAGILSALLLILAARLASNLRELRMEAQAVEEGLDLSGLLEKEQKRAHKLFQINSAEVRRYYDQALQQRRNIFYLGVLCILLGFASVFIAFSLILNPANNAPSEKIAIAILGTVSGILANFIAFMFLRMFSAIVQSMVDFHQRLVSTHHIVFSNVLVARIKDEKLRDDTLAEVALALSKVTVPEGKLNSGDGK